MDAAQTLLDIEHIKQLKHRYFRFVDTKDWEGVAGCFVPEATAGYPQQACGNRDEIIAFLSTSMVSDMVSMHQGHHPEIEVDGDTATGIWYLHDKVFLPQHDFCLEGAAIYTDSYVRTSEGWRKTHTGYERMFETTWSSKGVERWKIEQGAISRGRA
jgi:hypothetical protein